MQVALPLTNCAWVMQASTDTQGVQGIPEVPNSQTQCVGETFTNESTVMNKFHSIVIVFGLRRWFASETVFFSPFVCDSLHLPCGLMFANAISTPFRSHGLCCYT